MLNFKISVVPTVVFDIFRQGLNKAPDTHHVIQAKLKLIIPSASDSRVLRLQACPTTTHKIYILYK